MAEPKRVAIIGAGSIGSTFALRLAQAGHQVSVVARGRRLEQLSEARAIVTVSGERAPITPLASLPAAERFDLVIVTVLPHQVEAVVPQLVANPSPVMFMFNAFDGHATLREQVGRERFSWGFPAIVVALRDGQVEVKGDPSRLELLQITTIGALADHTPPWVAPWRSIFAASGLPTAIEHDMVAWLRTHVAFILPLMIGGLVVRSRGAGLRWGEARDLARGTKALFRLVRTLGHSITPAKLGVLAFCPTSLLNLGLFVLSRTALVRSAVTGVNEAKHLLGELRRLSPSAELEALESLVPREP